MSISIERSTTALGRQRVSDADAAHDPTTAAARAKAGDRWPDAEEAFEAGLAMRRTMFGRGGADDQIVAADDFSWPMQDFVTRWCFGETWTRGELSPAIRSMLTLSMLVAYGRPNEIKVHVQGAVANGVTPEQIREVMLHAMIYCGVPRAVEGFRVAGDTLRDMGAIS
jgi:4-carboxymuconolactone decarboxylase